MLRQSRDPFFALGFLVLVVASLSFARDYAVPVAVAVLIWFLINALADAITRFPVIGPAVPRRLAKGLAVVGSFIAIVFAIRAFVQTVGELGIGLSGSQEVAFAKIEAIGQSFGFPLDLTPEQLYDFFGFDTLLREVLGLAQGLVSDASLVFLYVMFLLVDERYYAQKLQLLVPDDAKRQALRITLARIAGETRAYLWLMSLISLGVALMTYAVARGVGLSGAGFWGFVAFALNFIPTIGSITAVVLPAVYGLLTLEDPIAVAILIGLLAATQFVAGEVVLPRVMGDRLNLSSVAILVVLVVWGAMWGPAGMFLAIPITVILTLVCARFEPTRPIAIILSKDGRVPHD
ncbi:MAG: AI-2E family transporter [Paracoccaceae bacterium]